MYCIECGAFNVLFSWKRKIHVNISPSAITMHSLNFLVDYVSLIKTQQFSQLNVKFCYIGLLRLNTPQTIVLFYLITSLDF